MISPKQRKILAFPYSKYDAIICDGAVRSGKTSIMMWAFVRWAMENFSGQRFGICGKTVDSCSKNIIVPFTAMTLAKEKYTMRWRRSEKILEVRRGGTTNWFEVFGGKDESSAALIQGRTLAGVLLDEVALMPRSFVEQALARCSVEGNKKWFSCNPESPQHWFYLEWIKKHDERNALYLHFTMRDNPGLTEKVIEQYESMFTGVFYDRYIRGLWVLAEGLVYDMFDPAKNGYDRLPVGKRATAARYIACDYGTTNPMVFLDVYDDGEVSWVEQEYRWDSRETHRQKTDQEYADDLLAFLDCDPEDRPPVIVDPSAASFIAELQRRGLYVLQGDNAVLDGIRRTATLFYQNRIRINRGGCEGLLGELGSYAWDQRSTMMGKEQPVKAMDHGPDALRYFVNTALPAWRYGEIE